MFSSCIERLGCNIMNMQRLSGFLSIAVIFLFTACKGHEKKILVYASSDIQTDNSKTNITVTEGTNVNVTV